MKPATMDSDLKEQDKEHLHLTVFVTAVRNLSKIVTLNIAAAIIKAFMVDCYSMLYETVVLIEVL